MDINSCFEHLNVGLPEDILRYKLKGDFANAIRIIDKRLGEGTADPALAACLRAEREMILRTPRDFPYTKEQAMEIIHRDIPDFTEEEFEERVDNGTVRWIFIDGEPHYFRRFYPTLIKTEPAFARRAGKIPGTTAAQAGAENPLNRCIHIMKEQGSMACRMRIRASVKMDDERFKPGMQVLAHLPIPADCEQQSEIVIEKMEPANGHIDPADAAARTVWWSECMQENHEFAVEYSYVHREVWHGENYRGTLDPEAGKYLCEQAPHILFTPYLKNLAAAITEGITEPMEKARAIFDFITTKMKYTFMPEYFTMENIAENCARSRTGDCGVFALLFITLCRICGIPACWQSGLDAEPDEVGCHDWARFYMEPYGWLLADPSYGVSSCRVGDEERRQFYFGNLEPWRMVANREFQAAFLKEKQGWRADPYDDQSGEMEADGIGLSFAELDCNQEILSYEEI